MTKVTPAGRKRGRPRGKTAAGAGGGTVQALERGIVVLKALARDTSLSLNELALELGMPAPSVYRLLSTLEKHGFADYDDETREWAIGVEAYRTGSAYLGRTSLVEVSRNRLRKLMEETGETANLAVIEDGDIVFISQVETQHPIRAFFGPGWRGALHSSGIGKAMLAQMPRRDVEKILQQKGQDSFTANTLVSRKALFDDLDAIRERGWSLDDEERYLGMRCIASSIFNAHGEPIAGISVSGPTVRFPDHQLQVIGPRVREAARQVTAAIGGKVREVRQRPG